MPKYEIALFNAEVRDFVKRGETHERYEDSWADTHYIEIDATDSTAARKKIESRYPESQGYVVEQVVQTGD